MKKERVFAVLGAGKQGAAAAFDFLRFGRADEVWMADANPHAAEAAAQRLRRLAPQMAGSVFSAVVDACDTDDLAAFLKPVHTLLSAVPWHMHPRVAEAALRAGANMCDLGGNTEITRAVLDLDSRAREAGVALVPDCGLAPGLVNTLAVYGIESMDSCEEVQLRCGGLPQTPRGPLDYKLVFAISGLTTEYFGKARVLRHGEVVEVETFTEREEIEFPPPVGRCEAFVTSGGSSTAPDTFAGRVQTYEYKTVRYPGHYEKMRVIKELGLLEMEPVCVGGVWVSPREVFHAAAAPRIDFPEDRDLVVVRATCRGTRGGRPFTKQLDILDFHDEEMGFSAMERTTGFAAAIVCEMVADGLVPPGAHRLEKAIPAAPFLEELVRRGISVRETESWQR